MEETIESLKNALRKYEENGVAKLYYSLNRKAWEMADMLNSIDLKNVTLDDPKDKTFERIRFIINDSSSVASAVEVLGKSTGITGNENDDVSKKPFVETIAESRK